MNQSASNIPPTFITRRRFVQFLLGFSVVSTIVGILIPIVGYLLPKETNAGNGAPTDIGQAADFPLNASKVVSIGDKPVIIVNTKTGGLKAFSAICTHLGCIVAWDDSKSIIHCPCHDGYFNPVNGSVISGPPPGALGQYEIVTKDGRVLVGNPSGRPAGG